MVIVVNYAIAMDSDNFLDLIENPFNRAREDNITLHTPLPMEKNTTPFFSKKTSNSYERKKEARRSRKKVGVQMMQEQGVYIEKRYVDILEKNKDGQYCCPYNCPDKYTHKKAKVVASHIKRRHDKDFDRFTFDPKTANLNVWISLCAEGKKRKYTDVFETNEDDEYECPYNCSYANKRGDLVASHIKRNHYKDFSVQTFDLENIDMNACIQKKKAKRETVISIYDKKFEINEDDEYMCPYYCPEQYSHEKGKMVVEHIKARHDSSFNSQTFDPEHDDLSVYIRPKRRGGRKRKGHIGVFKKNEDGEFKCPYNCPDNYAHKDSRTLIGHIKRRHDPVFDRQTFDRQTANLDAWIPKKTGGKKNVKYKGIFKKNKCGEFECPYNCPDKYTNKDVWNVYSHIRKRHNPEFDLQVFNPDEDDLDAYIPRTFKNKSRYAEKFEKNTRSEFLCPYNNCDYAKKYGSQIVQHIKGRHNKDFDFQTFDSQEADLDAYISKKRKTGHKRKRSYEVKNHKLKKKRKLKI